MRKKTKIQLITAASLVALGLMTFAAVMWAYGWDFEKLNTNNFETNTYEIRTEFHNISVNTNTADILFAPSDDRICRVVCYEQENVKHSVNAQDDTLTIDVADTRAWYEYIGINFNSPKITVYLPERLYASLSIRENTGDVEMPKEFRFQNVDISLSTGDIHLSAFVSQLMKIKTSTGDICVEDTFTKELKLSTSTGNITVTNVTCIEDTTINVSTGKTVLTDLLCKNLTSRGSTGDISLNNVIANGMLSIERSTGDVKFDSSDGTEITFKTDTGDVTGNFLTDKTYIVDTNTGRVLVPNSTTGGKGVITTDTGDILITRPLSP